MRIGTRRREGKTTVYFYTVDGILTQSSVYNRFKKQASSRILHGETHYKFSNSTQDSLFVFYTNNRRNGAAIFYYPNGSVMAQGQYKDGMLNGLLQQFYPNGKPNVKKSIRMMFPKVVLICLPKVLRSNLYLSTSGLNMLTESMD